jgi:glycerol-3-phosphate acyltransferase PlsY
MSFVVAEAIVILVAYLAGSIPSGVWVARACGGKDLRQSGSGNIGATNALRVLGKKAAVLTLMGDILKGAIPVGMARLLDLREVALLFVGLAAILGHLFPLYLRLKGGKGVATSFGVFLAMVPSVAATCLVVWGCGIYFGKYASVGALSAFAALPFATFFWTGKMNLVFFAALVSILVCLRHTENIQRLIRGTEKAIR